MIFESKDLLINTKDIPDADSSEYNDFWANERKKCKEGITIDGVFINPLLYWHTNLWSIRTDHITKGRIITKPSFRDSEWVLTNKIWEAETFKNADGEIRKKGVVAAGTRRFSKSVIEASFCAWKACNWKNSEILVSGGNEADIKIVTDMIDLGINELPDYYVKSKVEDNWRKQVSLGFKDKRTNQRNIWSTFAIRNFDDGNNEEVLAGLTPSGGIIDEAGKYKFLRALLAGLPGLSTSFGWRGTFLVMGTGGDMDKFEDFQKLFDDPESYNFLSCEIPEENRKCGIFLPGWMSYAYPKKKSNLADYLQLPKKDHPNLSKVDILVADKNENELLIDNERAAAAKSNDPSALLKQIMYFPKNTREIFLASSENNFPIEACKRHQEFLRQANNVEYIELYRNETNQVVHRFSHLLPINKFPVGASDDKNAPICIYEYPQIDVPHGTYVMGVDSYNKNESSDRINSLGCIYIYKRMYDPLGAYQNKIVASYRGRPSDINKFYEIAMNMAEYYGALILVETNERFCDYFVNRKKGHYLYNSIKLAQDINPKTMIGSGEKGLTPSTRNQRYGMELLVQYTIEEIYEKESPFLGVTRIPDPMLLEEMINYRAKPSSSKGIHDGNFDSIVAFYHALILAQHLDKYQPLTHWKSKQSEEHKPKKIPHIKTPFGNLQTKSHNMFAPSKGTKFKSRQFL